MLKTEFKFGEVHTLASQIEASADRVHFGNIFESENGGVSLLAFEPGQTLDTHLAPADVMVYAIEGEVVFTVFEKKHTLKAGDFLLMGEGVPHSVVANAVSKVLLVKVKSPK